MARNISRNQSNVCFLLSALIIVGGFYLSFWGELSGSMDFSRLTMTQIVVFVIGSVFLLISKGRSVFWGIIPAIPIVGPFIVVIFMFMNNKIEGVNVVKLTSLQNNKLLRVVFEILFFVPACYLGWLITFTLICSSGGFPTQPTPGVNLVSVSLWQMSLIFFLVGFAYHLKERFLISTKTA